MSHLSLLERSGGCFITVPGTNLSTEQTKIKFLAQAI